MDKKKEKMKFWITCPKCKHKFGVDGAIVWKYLQRLLRQNPKSYLEAVGEIAEEFEGKDTKREPQ